MSSPPLPPTIPVANSGRRESFARRAESLIEQVILCSLSTRKNIKENRIEFASISFKLNSSEQKKFESIL